MAAGDRAAVQSALTAVHRLQQREDGELLVEMAIIPEATAWLEEQGVDVDDLAAEDSLDDGPSTESISDDVAKTPTPPPRSPSPRPVHGVWDEKMEGDDHFDRFAERLLPPAVRDFDSLEWDIVPTDSMDLEAENERAFKLSVEENVVFGRLRYNLSLSFSVTIFCAVFSVSK